MNYADTISWLYKKVPRWQKQGAAAYRAKLDGIKKLTAHLGLPQHKIETIHVAGTNGKGSCCHMLASIFQEAGYNTGLYTSPHLLDFRERIKINGQPIAKNAVIHFIKKHQDFIQTHNFSFFEITVALAFAYFARRKVDIAIIETGLGGRLDSTNIITPAMSLITNIGLDHTAFLGDSLPEIAAEKAGIIKPGVPVVISEYLPETFEVFKKIAALQKAPLYLAKPLSFGKYKTDLRGGFQKKNIAAVLTLLKNLQGFDLKTAAIKNGLLKVKHNTGLPARWQKLQENPMVICDMAHNHEAIAAIRKEIDKMQFNKLHLVLGFSNDKPIQKLLKLFPEKASYYWCAVNNQRAWPASKLKETGLKLNRTGKSYTQVVAAFKAALEQAGNTDLVFIGGSAYVVSEILPLYSKNNSIA